jgi:hypothetical protein
MRPNFRNECIIKRESNFRVYILVSGKQEGFEIREVLKLLNIKMYETNLRKVLIIKVILRSQVQIIVTLTAQYHLQGTQIPLFVQVATERM